MNSRFSKIMLTASLPLACLPVFGQTTRDEMFATIEKTGGVYYAYPAPKATQNTPAPKGYTPFFINHYSRHGSRYLISHKDYLRVKDLLVRADKAGALTEKGRDVLSRLTVVCQEVDGTEGDLTPLGRREHRGIAERIYKAYPEVFAKGDSISARSTIVPRCAMSMVAYGDRLKELNPSLTIYYEMSEKYMDYLNYHTDESNRFTDGNNGPWVEEYRKFKEEHTRPDRLVASIFSSDEFVRKEVNPGEFMWGMYWIASNMQNLESKVSFYDVFEKEELFDLWQCANYQFYVGNANHAAGNGIVVANAKNLLRNILESADAALADPKLCAVLRFGHDGNVIPLAAIMRIKNFNVAVSEPEELYKYWCNFQVVPMAGNIQMVYYNKKGGKAEDVLVKILHNEQEVEIPVKTDMFPYYKWSDVKAFYQDILEK